MSDTPEKRALRQKQFWHIRVALYHLQQVKSDYFKDHSLYEAWRKLSNDMTLMEVEITHAEDTELLK